jgi:hypothetical protein
VANNSRTTDQAVSPYLPGRATLVISKGYVIFVVQNVVLEQFLLRLLRFPLTVHIPPGAPHSLFILSSTPCSLDIDSVVNKNYINHAPYCFTFNVLIKLEKWIEKIANLVETCSVCIQGGPDSIRQFLIINNQSIQQPTGKLESTFCCR